MNLSRYNQIVVAVAGTVFVLGALALSGALAVLSFGSHAKPGVEIASPGVKKPIQSLVFCPALTDGTGTFQYIPVAVVVAEDARRNPVLFSKGTRSFDDCAARRYGGSTRTFNVVVRNTASGEQRLLLDHPAQINSFKLPDEKCSGPDSQVPCGTILWEMRNGDTNHDGTIDGDDALTAFASDLSAKNLTALTPSDSTLLGSQWIKETRSWQFQIRRDSNHDGTFSDEDGAEVVEVSEHSVEPAKPFIQEDIMKSLKDAIR